jgi:4-hydroxybutyrate CoA-transferase
MTVFVAGGTAEPREILETLAEQGQSCAGVHFVSVPIPGLNQTDFSRLHEQAESTVFFATPENRDAIRSGRTLFIPLQYSAIFDYLERELPVDLVLAQLPEPNDGAISHGLSVDFLPAVLDKASVVVGEINRCQAAPEFAPAMPISRLDYRVDCERPIPTLAAVEIDRVARQVGARVAGLIADGDCIQLGIGAIPGATMAALTDRNDLGFHSGMISDGVMSLAQSGNITGRYKAVDTGKMVSGASLGSPELLDWASKTAGLVLRPVSYTHNTDVLRRIDNFVSINSALEVDLFGQVNADMLGGRQISATGGSIDMMRGAALSRGGRSIIALKSTARNGTVSTIRPALRPNTAATALRTDVDYVVTEYGARRLRYLSPEARARALIEIAHPDYQDPLRDSWTELMGG